jgi:hypothetical protein
MAALNEALKSLGHIKAEEIPDDKEHLQQFLEEHFKEAQTLIDSIPLAAPESSSGGRTRSGTVSSLASNASEMGTSDERPAPPENSDIEKLHKAWGKAVKLKPQENPLGMSVYKLAGNDGKGAWFARRSVHTGLPFEKFKAALEQEFPETLKVQGGPGEGNIRGIGGEKRIHENEVPGVGKVEVYHLSAQFPGPTTPRDFVTCLITSDDALDEKTAGAYMDGEGKQPPRHYMVISKPCIHPDAPEREGFIRGHYQSVEMIREVPVDPKLVPPKGQRSRGKSGSASDLARQAVENKGEGMEHNPVEWIMLTRSDPGGSVPRFMVERGTPGSIVADASKFLNWACGIDPETIEEEEEVAEPEEVGATTRPPTSKKPSYRATPTTEAPQLNGHLAGVGEAELAASQRKQSRFENDSDSSNESEGDGSGPVGALYSYLTTAAAAVASHTPAVIANRLPAGGSTAEPHAEQKRRTYSVSSSSSDASGVSFTSALEGDEAAAAVPSSTVVQDTAAVPPGQSQDTEPFPALDEPAAAPSAAAVSSAHRRTDTLSSVKSNASTAFSGEGITAHRERARLAQEKEYAKLEDRKRRLTAKLEKIRQREASRGSEDSSKQAAAVARAEEKYAREMEKQEEKYKREVQKVIAKREKEERKRAEKGRRAGLEGEVKRLNERLQEVGLEAEVLRVERDLLRKQVGELQRENTILAVGVGKLGEPGKRLLGEVREGRAATFGGADDVAAATGTEIPS